MRAGRVLEAEPPESDIMEAPERRRIPKVCLFRCLKLGTAYQGLDKKSD